MSEANGTRPVALVTAASRGIGAACATKLAARGYELVIMSRSAEIERVAATLRATAVRGAVEEPSSIEKLVKLAMEKFGRVDVVINNTGDPISGELLELGDDIWHNMLDLVVLNVVRMARLVTPIMKSNGGGSIVNISAADAFEPDLRFPLASTFRAALGAWTKLYADRHAADGIRMNSVLPGFTMPERLSLDRDTQHWQAIAEAEVPMKRPARYDEIGAVAAFLASPESSYITGQNLRVDGGLTRSV